MTLRVFSSYGKHCTKFLIKLSILKKKILRKIENFSYLKVTQKKPNYFENLIVYR